MYYALMPDRAGSYAVKTEIGYIENGNYNFYQNLDLTLKVDKDTAAMAADIINELNRLHASGKDVAKIKNAIRHLENVQRKGLITGKDINKNIHDVLKAADLLVDVKHIDVSYIRLEIDKLLKIWESKYYFSE